MVIMKKKKAESNQNGNLRRQAEDRLKASQRGLVGSERENSGDAMALVHELQVHQIELEMQNEELKRATLETEGALTKYSDLYDFAPIGLFTIDQLGLIREANLMGAKLLGVERRNLVKRHFRLFVAPKDRPSFDDFWKSALETTIKQTCELNLLRDGEPTIYAHIEGMAADDESLNGRQCRVVVLDITDRKKAEMARQESEERYRDFFRTSRDCVFITSVEGRWVDLNDAAVQFFGFDNREDLLKVKIRDLYVNPDERTRHIQTINENGYVQEYPATLRKKDGTSIDTLITSVAGKDSTGRIIGYRGTIRDVTDRKRAEDALRESHQILDGIINAMPVRVFWKDRNLVYLGCNATFARDAGFADPKDIVGKDDYQMAWRDQAELYRADDRQVIESGCPKLLIEEPQTTPEGNTIVLLTSKIPLRSSKGEILGVLGTYMDITERKRIEKALRESEERFRTLFESSRDAMMTIVPPSWRFGSGNSAAIEMFGAKDESEFTSLGPLDVSPELQPDGLLSADKARGMIEIARLEGSNYFEWMHKRLSGETFPATVLLTRMELLGETIIQATVRDISDQKRAEEELRQHQDHMEVLVRERTAEMERFIYTVSHDLRSPLVTMGGFVGLLKEDLENGDALRASSDLLTMSESITKMDRLLVDTLELSRIGRVVNPPADVSFGEIVKEALRQTAERTKSQDIAIYVAEDMPKVRVDTPRIEEVLVNLIENSVKYMGGMERPKIEIGFRKDDEETVFFIKDNGIGIDPKEHEKVFGLFYKVDRTSEGTGVGLAIVKRIIEVHGGRIWIESELGKGCTVCFTLPLANVG